MSTLVCWYLLMFHMFSNPACLVLVHYIFFSFDRRLLQASYSSVRYSWRVAWCRIGKFICAYLKMSIVKWKFQPLWNNFPILEMWANIKLLRLIYTVLCLMEVLLHVLLYDGQSLGIWIWKAKHVWFFFFLCVLQYMSVLNSTCELRVVASVRGSRGAEVLGSRPSVSETCGIRQSETRLWSWDQADTKGGRDGKVSGFCMGSVWRLL